MLLFIGKTYSNRAPMRESVGNVSKVAYVLYVVLVKSANILNILCSLNGKYKCEVNILIYRYKIKQALR